MVVHTASLHCCIWCPWLVTNADSCHVLQLELVQDNLKYFLEIMQNNKSVLLEWLIIGLIAAEIALGIFEIITRV